MSRPLRVEYAGAFYHVINRGNAREKIFYGDKDRDRFLQYLAVASERFSIIIKSYCLMTNHYHLLIQTPEPNLSAAIQWVNVSYATYLNKKRRRSGHLFQGRFKSILVQADEYLPHVSRYIHLNPVHAGMVKKPDDYLWSSYCALIGRIKAPHWLETNGLLSKFGRNRKQAIKGYRDYVEKADIEKMEYPYEHLVGGFILGNAGFVNWVKKAFLAVRRDEREVPQLMQLKPKVSIEKVLLAVCEEFGVSEDHILVKGKKANKARDLAIYLARDISGETCKKLGEYFGGITGPGITMRYNRFINEMKHDKRLKGKIAKIKKQLVIF